MKNKWRLMVVLLAIASSSFAQTSHSETEIQQLLNSWHRAAAEAQFAAYFELMAEDAIFIGTDATENWNKKEFEIYAKPHFDKGKAWSFMALERHVYFDSTGNTAWFDEVLDTQMKICRGSGVLVNVGGRWKIKHYVLSMTIPNETSKAVIALKTPVEDAFIRNAKSKL